MTNRQWIILAVFLVISFHIYLDYYREPNKKSFKIGSKVIYKYQSNTPGTITKELGCSPKCSYLVTFPNTTMTSIVMKESELESVK